MVVLSSTGIQPNDLDAYVKFEFPYPTAVSLFKLILNYLEHVTRKRIRDTKKNKTYCIFWSEFLLFFL